ncbi:MAG: hypothetical protein JW864_00460 [Spirochaetes bacterium]|nr:hypothetical protein [Spirochaetota bacterium]
MSKITLSPIITDVRNRMGNVVFSKWKDTNYVRQYTSRSGGSSERQLEIRNAFATAVSIWKNTGSTLHATWDAYAQEQNINMSGYNAFIKANLSRILDNTAMELFKSTGENEPLSLAAGPSPASGEIICEFILPVSQEQRHVIFFTQRSVNGKPAHIVSMHEAGADPASPFSIAGLEPGAEYHVYAIASDADYANAVTISAAASITTAAGA